VSDKHDALIAEIGRALSAGVDRCVDDRQGVTEQTVQEAKEKRRAKFRLSI
jgi:hypothetical protein